MKEGLDFLSPEHGIMQYSYDPFYEEEPECLPMYLWQQIRVVYDSNDMVTDYLVDYYNSYSRETYDIYLQRHSPCHRKLKVVLHG